MVSSFVRTNRAISVGRVASTVIQLQKAYTTCDANTGEVSIQWPANAAVGEGVLGDDVFASGTTKNVHEVQQYSIIVGLNNQLTTATPSCVLDLNGSWQSVSLK